MEPPEFRQFDIIKLLEEEQCPNDSRRATRTLEAALEAQIELFCNAAGEPLVRVHGERQGQVWPLRSPRVRHWLAVLCWEKNRRLLSAREIDNLVGVLAGKAWTRPRRPMAPDALWAQVDADPVAQAVIEFMSSQEQWEGLVSELLGPLSDLAETHKLAGPKAKWPRIAVTLGARLRAVAALLEQAGVKTSIKHTKTGSRVRLEKVTIEDQSHLQTGDSQPSESQTGESQPSDPDRSPVRLEKVTLAGDGDDENPRPSPGPSPVKPKPDKKLPKGDAGDDQKRAKQNRATETQARKKRAGENRPAQNRASQNQVQSQGQNYCPKRDADWRDLFRAHARTDPPPEAGNDRGSDRPGRATPTAPQPLTDTSVGPPPDAPRADTQSALATLGLPSRDLTGPIPALLQNSRPALEEERPKPADS